MIEYVKKNRYLVMRRIMQTGLLLLFAGSYRWGWKILTGTYSSARVLGTFYLADPHAVLQALAAGFVMSATAWLGAAVVLLFYALLAGRSFCSWVCPVNVITDLASWMRKKLHWPEQKALIPLTRKARYWALALGLVLSALTGVAAFEVINPITLLQRGIIYGFGAGWTMVVAVFLFDLLLKEHGWCGHICPLGAFYTLTTRFALLKVKHDAGKCTLCMKCKEVCHEVQVLELVGKNSGYVQHACSNCGRCIEVCEDDALRFSVFNYKKI